MRDLRGCNAILTGASRGLGVHVAHALAREGVNLTLAARSEGELERVRARVAALGVTAAAVPADVGDRDQLEALVARAEAEVGPTDILVNNAGVAFPAMYHTYPVEQIEAIVRVNLLGAMTLTRLVLPGMLARRRGHIVNMSSLAGKSGVPGEAPYATTKAALVMFTHTLRVELQDSPVAVSVVCPGFVAEDGMYMDIETLGERLPPLLRPTTTTKVTRGVMKALRRGSPELIVNALPIRPLLTLAEIAPAIIPRVHRSLGALDFARRVAARAAERAEGS